MAISKRFIQLSILLAAALLMGTAQAATPSSGRIDGNNPSVSWEGPLPPPPPTASASCNGPNDPSCDHFQLSVGDPGFPFAVEIVLDQGGGDWDVGVFDSEGNEVGGSGNSPGIPEVARLPACTAGEFTVSASPFAPGVPSYSAEAHFIELANCGGSGDQPPTDLPNTGAFITTAPISVRPADPDFDDYAPSFGDTDIGGDGAGEPSIGLPHSLNAELQQTEPTKTQAMYVALLDTLRATEDMCTSPAQFTWVNRSPLNHVTSLDPILETDHVSSRTFSSQLLGKASAISYSDDNGETWFPSQGSGINSGVDHQTVGVGPFADNDPIGPIDPSVYDRAVYYASQDVAAAQAAISRDGGLTFGPAVPMWTVQDCNGLHGHIEVAENDGTVYVPNGGCNNGASSGFGISLDGGTTWETPRIVPGMGPGDDPGMGVATDGTLYFAQCTDGNAYPKVAVSTDKGLTWTAPNQLGESLGIQQCAFPAVAAGDGDRAAVFYLGSTKGPPSAGTSNSGNGGFTGAWHAYVSITYDGGESWTTYRASPQNDPVQRGEICLGGTGCDRNRNLLDFNDIQEDHKGRVWIAYADGCTGVCVNDQYALTQFDEARIGVMRPGIKGLYAAYDDELAPAGTSAPRSPFVEARTIDGDVEVRWSEPYDGGEAIQEYRVYRQSDVESRNLIATTGPDQHAFLDEMADPSANPRYEVVAVNANGASQAPATCDNSFPISGEVQPPPEQPPMNPCGFPGTRVRDDALGDQDPALGGEAQDIDWVSVHEKAEDSDGDGVVDEKLFFILKVASLEGPIPPNNNWRTEWVAPNGVTYFVSMESNELSQVSFSYGWLDDSSGQRIYSTSGDADFGTFKPDGTITIVNSIDKFDAIATGSGASGMEPGAVLTYLTSSTEQLVGAAGTGLLQPIDSTISGGYEMIGNAACDNNPPVAMDDSAETTENTPVLIDVLANDSDPDGDELNLDGFRTDAGNGEAVVVNDDQGQVIEYRPDEGFTGTDSFEYIVRDGRGGEDTATVTVTVSEDGGKVTEIDDADPAVEYKRGWHRKSDGDASNGGYHVRMGGNDNGNGDAPTARLVFQGSEITYFYGTSERGGTADIYLDGELVADDFSYAGTAPKGDPDFGQSVTFDAGSDGSHELVIAHQSGAAFVDGFSISGDSDSGADASAPESSSKTTTESKDASLLGLVSYEVDLQASDLDVSVIVEGLSAASTVQLLNPAGVTVGSGEALLDGFAVSGLDADVESTGTYTVQVLSPSTENGQVHFSVARTVPVN